MEKIDFDRLNYIIKNKKKSKIRKYGISFAIGMFLLSVILFIKGVNYIYIAIPIFFSIYHIIFAIINTKLVYPFYVMLSFIGKIIGNLLTGIIFTIVFYLFITPISILLRFFKKDHIINKYTNTNWIDINDNYNDSKRIEKLF